jgi:hypothetical protein
LLREYATSNEVALELLDFVLKKFSIFNIKELKEEYFYDLLVDGYLAFERIFDENKLRGNLCRSKILENFSTKLVCIVLN